MRVVYVSVIRGGVKVRTVELKFPYRYANASPTATDYIPDTEWVNLSTDLELKNEDAVLSSWYSSQFSARLSLR